VNCIYLSGENIAPRTTAGAKSLIGLRVTYLMSSDIDKSGRGYVFPQHGVIAAVVRKEIAIDSPMNFVIDMGRLVEMVAA